MRVKISNEEIMAHLLTVESMIVAIADEIGIKFDLYKVNELVDENRKRIKK